MTKELIIDGARSVDVQMSNWLSTKKYLAFSWKDFEREKKTGGTETRVFYKGSRQELFCYRFSEITLYLDNWLNLGRILLPFLPNFKVTQGKNLDTIQKILQLIWFKNNISNQFNLLLMMMIVLKRKIRLQEMVTGHDAMTFGVELDFPMRWRERDRELDLLI